MSDAGTIAAIAGGLCGIAALATVCTFWMGLGATKRDAAAAVASAHEAHQRIDRLAETSASKGDIDALRRGIENLTQRVDTLIASLAQKVTGI